MSIDLKHKAFSLYLSAFLIAVTLISFATLAYAKAESHVYSVTGNTATAENQPGWLFNRDESTSSPYEFSTSQKSLGNGSLFVQPIGSNASDKFVAENFYKYPVSDISSISYDFMVAGNGNAASAQNFYLNVYANFDDSNNYYSCRFDYSSVIGSTSAFTTASFSTATMPTLVKARNSAPCPTTLAAMPEGSYVRMFSLSVGDTSANDEGLAGYLDNVQVNRSNGDTDTYDFEIAPIDNPKDETAPDVQVSKPPASINTRPTITGTIDDQSAIITVSVDGQTFFATINSDGTWSAIPPDALAPDDSSEYTIIVTAVDAAGNASEKTTSVRVYTPADPGVVIDNPAVVDLAITPTTTSSQENNLIATIFGTNDNTSSVVPTEDEADAAIIPTSQNNVPTDSGEVLGTSDENQQTGFGILGLAWYWWLIIIAALATLFGMLVKRKRKQQA